MYKLIIAVLLSTATFAANAACLRVFPPAMGDWLLTVQDAPADSPTRFIMTVGVHNVLKQRGSVVIAQDDGFRSHGQGPYMVTNSACTRYKFRDQQFHYDDQPPYAIIAVETHEFDMVLTGENTGVSINPARILIEELDGTVLSDDSVPLDFKRLPDADF